MCRCASPMLFEQIAHFRALAPDMAVLIVLNRARLWHKHGIWPNAALHTTDRKGPSARQSSMNWRRSEEHTSELQSLMRISYAVFCLKKKTNRKKKPHKKTSQ